jgi:hypothetical protein
MLSEIRGQTYLADSSDPRGSNLLRVARRFLRPTDELWTRGSRAVRHAKDLCVALTPGTQIPPRFFDLLLILFRFFVQPPPGNGLPVK